jgi:hypothetical protein
MTSTSAIQSKTTIYGQENDLNFVSPTKVEFGLQKALTLK